MSDEYTGDLNVEEATPARDELIALISNNMGVVIDCTSHLDLNGDGTINVDDGILAGQMTEAECQAVIDAYNACLTGCTVTCTSDDCPNTLGITTGCDLLLHYDIDNDGVISMAESMNAIQEYYDGKITYDEATFVENCWKLGSINAACPGCYVAPRPPPCGNYGDVNDDGYVTEADAQLIANCLVGLPGSELTEEQLRRADVSGNGSVSMSDAIIIQQYVEGIIDTFPVCELPIGDITKVTLDDNLLPEDGTLDWLLNDDAIVNVYFKNAGTATGAFTLNVVVTDPEGNELYNETEVTGSIPADGIEYYVEFATRYTPITVEVKTITVSIVP